MGGDGGSIAKREDIVKTKKAAARADQRELARVSWSACALTEEPLADSRDLLCACRLGYIFKKEELVRALIAKSLPAKFQHIKGLKDFVDLRLAGSNVAAESAVGTEGPLFACPVSGAEAGCLTDSFVVLATCGHVFSEKSLSETNAAACLVCNKAFESTDRWALNPPERTRDALRLQLIQQRENELKRKKRKGTDDHKNSRRRALGIKSNAGGNLAPRKRAAEAPLPAADSLRRGPTQVDEPERKAARTF